MTGARRIAAAAAAFVGAAAAAPAQPDLGPGTIRAQVDRWAQTCEAAPQGLDCLVGLSVVMPQAQEALTMLAFAGDRAAALPVVREALSSKAAPIRMSAAWALANLGPEPEDLPLLVARLMEPVPEVRHAALAALRRLADPKAQALAARAGRATLGDRSFRREPFPFDPAKPEALGLPAWPAATRFLFFDRTSGGLPFVTSASVDEVASAFAAASGDAPKPLAEAGEPAASLLSALAGRGEIRVVALKPAGAPDPAWAGVYADAELGGTGFVLVYATPPALTPTGGDAPPVLPADLAWTPPAEPEPVAASDEEAAAYAAALADDEAGIDAFLAAYPDGAFAAEAAALAEAPRLTLDTVAVGDQGATVTATARNLPPGRYRVVATATPSEGPDGGALANAGASIEGPGGEVALEIKAGVPEGPLDVAVVDANGRAVAYRQLQVLTFATLSLDAPSVRPGGRLGLTIGGMPGIASNSVTADRLDVVRLQDDGAPVPVASYNVSGLDAGPMAVRAPDEPGKYQASLYYAADAYVTDGEPPAPRAVAAFTVEGEPAAPSPPGPPSIEAAEAYEPGEPFMVRVSGLPDAPDAEPRILLVEAGAPDSARGQSGAIARGLLDGPAHFGGQPEGDYELRVVLEMDFSDFDAPLTIAARRPVRIGAAPSSPEPGPATAPDAPPGASPATGSGPIEAASNGVAIRLDKPVFAAGERIPVHVTGLPGNDDDWITIVRADAPDTTWGTWTYTKGAKAGTFELQGQSPGRYEARVYFDDSSRDRTVRARLAFDVR